MSIAEYKKKMPLLFGSKKADIQTMKSGLPYNALVPVFNKKMQLVIPTHRRPTRQFTLKSLCPEMQKEVLLVTSTVEDAKELRVNFKDILRPEQVYAVNDSKINGIAIKRQWLVENIGSQSIFMMDDDQYFFARCDRKYRELEFKHSAQGSWIVKPKYKEKIGDNGKPAHPLLAKGYLTPARQTQLFRLLQDMMTRTENRYVHTCVSSRMGNNQVPESIKVVGRAMHSIGMRRDALIDNDIRFTGDGILLREDFYVTLQLLKRGLPNAIVYEAAFAPADYDSKGGCSGERSVELSNSQAKLLASLFPGCVRLVEKAYTHSVPRLEVQIQWNKLYNQGVNKKATSSKKSLFG